MLLYFFPTVDSDKAGRSKRTISEPVKRECCLEGQQSVITVPLLYLLTPVENRSHSRDPMLLNSFKKKKSGINWVNSYVIKILEGPFSFLIWIMHLVMILFYKRKCLLQGILSSSRQIAQSSCQTKCGFPVNSVNFSHAYFVSRSDGKWSD